MSQKYLNVILGFVQEAGALAMTWIHKSRPALKTDRSVITQTDQAVSELGKRYLKNFLETNEHILIDEENFDHLNYFNQDFLKKFPYLWSLDPIDGTRLYANRIPLFAVSIGLFRNLKPWLGAVYFPALKELFYCDGENAFFVAKAFTAKPQKIKIKPADQDISSFSILLCDDETFREYAWDYKNCQIMVSASAALDLCWPTIGRGCASVFKSSLWDLAGSWPIAQKAGFQLRSLSSGKVLDSLDLNQFEIHPKPWRVKEFYLLSSEKNYGILKAKLNKYKTN